MDIVMGTAFRKVYNDIQDRDSLAWKRLCEYIDELAESGGDEFAPREYLGAELFEEISSLPKTISKLKRVRKVWLYGSQLRRIPPEIGEMESLEYFDVYTSYKLRWFPYEITMCRQLADSRISTRALYTIKKGRAPFPRLDQNPFRYHGETVRCSVCRQPTTYDETDQVWISLEVGTDVVPLLANLCSKECEGRLPEPPEGCVRRAHKGGEEAARLASELRTQRKAKKRSRPGAAVPDSSQIDRTQSTTKLLKIKTKIWDQ